MVEQQNVELIHNHIAYNNNVNICMKRIKYLECPEQTTHREWCECGIHKDAYTNTIITHITPLPPRETLW